MRRQPRRRALAGLILSAAVSLSACRPQPSSEAVAPDSERATTQAAVTARFEVGHCQEGGGAGVVATTRFAPSDAICVAVADSAADLRLRLAGAGDPPVDLAAELEVSESGSRSGRFARPGGWPPGRYRLSLWAEDRELAAREIEVRAEIEPQLPPA